MTTKMSTIFSPFHVFEELCSHDQELAREMFRDSESDRSAVEAVVGTDPTVVELEPDNYPDVSELERIDTTSTMYLMSDARVLLCGDNGWFIFGESSQMDELDEILEVVCVDLDVIVSRLEAVAWPSSGPFEACTAIRDAIEFLQTERGLLVSIKLEAF